MHVKMTKASERSKKNGFTLSEVLIALAMVAGTVLIFITLFPAAQNGEQQSTMETRSTLISESIMEALDIGHSSGALRVATGFTNGLPSWTTIDPRRASNIIVSYNSSCEPLCRLDPASAASPLTNMQAVAVATLTLAPTPSTPGLISVEVSVSSPASAPSERRTTHRFTRLLAIP